MLDIKHVYYLQQMGIDVWLDRRTLSLKSEPSSCNVRSVSLMKLSEHVSVCQRCSLHQSRTQTVFSRGTTQAKLMVIGEAPGVHEDKQGQPFVGKAGALFDRMLFSIGLTEEHVYMANVLKCRPPNDRDPQADEIAQCSDYLVQQIKAVNPKLLLAVGRCAGQFLLQQPLTLAEMRGKTHHYHDIPVVVSYHPAYLLQNPMEKKKTYQDLLRVRRVLMKYGSHPK